MATSPKEVPSSVSEAHCKGFAEAIARVVQLTEWHACLSGDCPHEKWADCEEALIAEIRALAPSAASVSEPVPTPTRQAKRISELERDVAKLERIATGPWYFEYEAGGAWVGWYDDVLAANGQDSLSACVDAALERVWGTQRQALKCGGTMMPEFQRKLDAARAERRAYADAPSLVSEPVTATLIEALREGAEALEGEATRWINENQSTPDTVEHTEQAANADDNDRKADILRAHADQLASRASLRETAEPTEPTFTIHWAIPRAAIASMTDADVDEGIREMRRQVNAERQNEMRVQQ